MSKIFHTGNIIIFGFVVAALSMLYLAYLTTTVEFDLAAKGDYYEMEMNVNDQHKAMRNVAYLGNDFEVKSENDQVVLSLPPRISSQIQNGKVEFYCYSDSKNDKVATLEAKSDGQYAFAKSDFMPGKNYNIKISFESNGSNYYKEVRMY